MGPKLQISLTFLLSMPAENSGEQFASVKRYSILIPIGMVGSRNRLSYFTVKWSWVTFIWIPNFPTACICSWMLLPLIGRLNDDFHASFFGIFRMLPQNKWKQRLETFLFPLSNLRGKQFLLFGKTWHGRHTGLGTLALKVPLASQFSSHSNLCGFLHSWPRHAFIKAFACHTI